VKRFQKSVKMSSLAKLPRQLAVVCSRRSPSSVAEGLAAWAATTEPRISAALPGESATQCGSRQRPMQRRVIS
jgi:hypothetical protein